MCLSELLESTKNLIIEYGGKVHVTHNVYGGYIFSSLDNPEIVKEFQVKLESFGFYNGYKDKAVIIFNVKRNLNQNNISYDILFGYLVEGIDIIMKRIKSFLEKGNVTYHHIYTIKGVKFNKNFRVLDTVSAVNNNDIPKELREYWDSKFNFHSRYYSTSEWSEIRSGLIYTAKIKVVDIEYDVEEHIDDELKEVSKIMRMFELIFPLLTSVPIHLIKNYSIIDRDSILRTNDGSSKALPSIAINSMRKTDVNTSELGDYISKLGSLAKKDYLVLTSTLRRFNNALIVRSVNDSYIDLRIILESLLSSTKHDTPIRHTVSLRGGWLLGKTVEERVDYSKRIKKLYDYGSKAVHGSSNNVTSSEILHNSLNLVCELIKTIIKNGKVFDEETWTRLTFGS